MGRASRSKAQRQGKRSWSTIDPTTGKVERFMVSISEQALEDWERERDDLRRRGYPDRPPEVDTPSARSWTLAGSGTGSGVVRLTLGADASAHAVGFWAVEEGGVFVRAQLGQRPDRTYVLSLSFGELLDPIRGVISGLREIVEAVEIVRVLTAEWQLSEPTFVSAEQILKEIRAAA